jgi:hypothetical protein
VSFGAKFMSVKLIEDSLSHLRRHVPILPDGLWSFGARTG